VIVPDGEPAAWRAARDSDFAQVYQRHYPAVFAFAHRRVGDRVGAEDVAAQTFLQALQAFPRYEDRGAPISAWLLRIAANVIAGQARRNPQELTLGGTPVDEAMQGRQTEGDRDDWVDRRALWLRYGEDRALEDVAGHVGRTPAATKQLLHRTLKTLRARMQTEIQIGGGR